MKEDERSGACNMYRRDEICIHSFGLKTLRDETTWQMWA
jgi:hypothetical protein